METVRRARGLVGTMKRKIEGKVGNDNGAVQAGGPGLQEDGQVGGNDREEPRDARNFRIRDAEGEDRPGGWGTVSKDFWK